MRKILALLVIAIFGYEGYALHSSETGDTVSEIVWGLSDRWPVITLAFGLLMGHFFWSRRTS